MDRKILAALMLVVAAGSFGIGGSMFSIPVSTSEQTYEGVGYSSSVCVTIERADGDVEKQPCVHNTLTNAGRQMMINYLKGNTAQLRNVTVLAIGNSTAPAITDTTTLAGDLSNTGCGLANVTANLQNTNQTAYALDWQWTNTCTNQVVNTTAIFNSTSTGAGGGAGVMEFAGATLTSSTLQNTDKINVTYTVNIG